jgi:hypothetical protein
MSKKLGRREKLSPDMCKLLVSPTRNPVRRQLLEAQIQYHSLPVVTRTLQKSLKRHTKKGQKYKMPYVNKELKGYHLQNRVNYGKRHLGKTVNQFWRFVRFTDEFHIDLAAMGQGFILREQGTRYNAENIQQRPKLEGNKIHCAGWVTYDSKIKKLIFYNEQEEYEQQPPPPRKPRRTMYLTDQEYT